MPSARTDAIVAALTTEEKLRLIRGRPDPDGRATGYLPGVERAGIPPLGLVDGPLGVRDGAGTAFPATLALGASWDPDLARRFGAALAAETRVKGHDVVLAPGVNVVRVPTCGRNFEYYAEDPRLTARLGAACVAGIEDAGVAATVSPLASPSVTANPSPTSRTVTSRSNATATSPSSTRPARGGATAATSPSR